MTRIRQLRRIAAACGLSLACAAAWADGAGTLNDSTLSLEHSGGPYVIPNLTPLVFGLADQEPLCEPGTQTCDVYTLTIDISDAFRAAQPNALVELVTSWPDPTGQAALDYDVYFYGPDGRVADAATSANPEFISVPLEVLPNGKYEVRVIPFNAAAQEFTLEIDVTGLEETAKSGLSALVGGALGAGLLLPLLAMALVRRRR